jgi:hypothetical protein
MSFKVKYRGLEIVCDTIQDIDALADNLETISTSKPKVLSKGVKSETPVGNATVKYDSALTNFVSRLKDRQRTVIRVLLDNPQGVSDKILREKVGAKNNEALAGVTSVMSRAAKATGLNYEEIVKKTVVSSVPGNRAYDYQISESAREELQSALDSNVDSNAQK